MNQDEASQNFRNLCLSYRGAERQAPNTLQLALRMSRVMEIRQGEGKHPPHWGMDDRLRDVVQEFHTSSGVTARNQIDEERFKALANIISGTSAGAREVLGQHLNHHKWQHCAFSSEQLKSSRWLLKTSPKMASCPMKTALSVSEEAQIMHLELVVHSFLESGRKLRASARSRMRLSAEQFDRYCDFSCIYAAVLVEARQLTSWTPEKESQVKKIFLQKNLWLCINMFWLKQR